MFNDFRVDITTIVTRFRHYRAPCLRFRAHSFRDNTLPRNTLWRRAPPQDTVLFYVYARVTFLHRDDFAAPSTAPRCTLSENTLPARSRVHYPVLSAAIRFRPSFLRARLRRSILPLSPISLYTANSARHLFHARRRWR